MKDIIRVLIVDDSQSVRTILVSMLESVPGFEAVGEAKDGEEAVRLTASLRPDVITMDIRMPRMDGLEATRQIMRTTPTPIVVVANRVYESDLNIAFNAVEAGALTVVEKPRGLSEADFEAVRDQLVTTVRLMSDVQVVTLWSGEPPAARAPQGPAAPAAKPVTRPKLIAIGASTGGPGILHQILQGLPGNFPIPVLIVQHITLGFGQGFAHWLGHVTPLRVALAQEGEHITPERVYIAPDDLHLTIAPGGTIRLERSAPISGRRPSATRLFESAAKAYGPATLGIILTGMGDDGVDGLAALQRAGGRVIAQNEESCVVFGMPKVAIEQGLVDQVLAPDDIASLLRNLAEGVKQ
jgi:two-component system chemotaxis response regulator CheB